MIADESLVTLSMLKKYDQTKGTPVVEADTLPVLPLNKVYNVGGSPIELSASGTCTHETSPGEETALTIENLEAVGSGVLPAAGTYTLTYTEDTDWTSREITYRDLTFTAVKRYKIDDDLFEKAAFADSVTIDGTVHSNVTNGEVFTGAGWVIIWNIWSETDNAYDGSIYLTDANATLPTVVSTVANGLNGWQGSFSSIPEGATEVVFNNDYTVKIGSHPFPYGEHALYGAIDGASGTYMFMVIGYNVPSPTATATTPGSGLYMGDCFINHLPAGSSFKLKSSIDNVWHTVSYPLPENGTFIYGTSLSEESCLVIQTNDNKLRVVTIDETQNQAFTIDYEEETSTRVFSKSTELITKDSANDLFIPQSEKGVASGVATLGADGKVPRSQLTVEAMEYKGKVYVNTPEPTDKSVGDVYFVGETGTIWGKSVNEGDQLVWSGSAWDVWSAGRVLSVDGKTNEVVINQSLTSTQYNNLTTIDPKVNYFVTDKKQIYRNGYCYSITVKALSQTDYNNLTAWEKNDTMALYIVDNNKLYYLDHPVGMLGNELRYTTSIPTEDGFFVYVGNVPNAAGLYRGCIYYKNGSTYTLYTPKYTEDILEKSALSNIGTSANATQHDVNAAIDTLFTQVGKVKTVNSQVPDSNGNVSVDVGVKTVNSTSPDANGNFNINVGVKTVNSVLPDANGNVNIVSGNVTASLSGNVLTLVF